jgi:hypothetical protein
MPDHPFLPKFGLHGETVISDEFMSRYLDAGRKTRPVRPASISKGIGAAVQSARREVTATFERTVLKATKSPQLCAAKGHVVFARPWVEVPGHYDNWFRVVGCECGKLAVLQTTHSHQDPDLTFFPQKRSVV